MIYEELKTFFRIYDDIAKQNRFLKPGSGEEIFKLITPTDGVLPWQLKTPVPSDESFNFSEWKIYDAETDLQAYDFDAHVSLVNRFRKSDKSFDYWVFNGGTMPNVELENGFYYMMLVINDKTYYSEIFSVESCLKWSMENYPYMLIEVDNGDNADLDPILYNVGWKQKIFVDEVLENETPTIEEEGIENGAKQFIPTLQRFVHNLRLDVLTSFFAAESFVLMCMHKRVVITTPNGLYTGQIREMKPNVVQLQNTNLYTVSVEFQQDSPYLNTSCAKSIQLLE